MCLELASCSPKELTNLTFGQPRHDNRYQMMRFAFDKTMADAKFRVPRQILLGNFKLCGVLLAYQPPEAL